ncbi:MAG: ACT domain-containing protein [Tissierellia bacterium]|nr:ACT domain-containing protein [Tissierellia bacterium]
MIKQISVFVENISGSLAAVTRILAAAGINIRAFSVMDTTEFGILRLLVDDFDNAEKLLKENGFGMITTDVIGIELEDEPGALNRVLQLLSGEGYFVNYVYSMVLRGDKDPLMVLHVEEAKQAEAFLKEKGIRVV